MTLPITKEQFVQSIPSYIENNHRLPYLEGDTIDVEVENDKGDLVNKNYVASRYIEEYFDTHEKLTDYLYANDLLDSKTVGEHTGLNSNRVDDLINGDAKRVDIGERHAIHIFFNKDFYEDLGKYNQKVCNECRTRNTCGQPYWVSVISCPKFKQSTRQRD